MIWSMAAGLVCGLATVAISDGVLRIGGPVPQRSLFRLLVTGVALRTLWTLALLAWALSGGVTDPRGFVPALLAGYLAGQVFEGVRYARYFERC